MKRFFSLLLVNSLRFLLQAQQVTPPAVATLTCPATTPTHQRPPSGNYGNEFIATTLTEDGKIVFAPGGPGFVLKDGSLAMKQPWWRLVKGQLVIEGHRLDSPAVPLRAAIPTGYGETGFQATGLIFPTPGCWEVKALLGEHSLTFVTEVVKIGAGPVPSR